DRLRELEGIAQPDIEPLAGDGVQCLRGVANNHAPGADGCACVFERERKGAPGLEAGGNGTPPAQNVDRGAPGTRGRAARAAPLRAPASRSRQDRSDPPPAAMRAD